MKGFGWKHIILALLVGIIAGFALCLHVPRHRLMPWKHGGDPNTRLVERFSRGLNLTADQRTKLVTILERSRKRLDSLRGEIGPKFEAIRRETNTAIEKILTPEQVARFRQLHRKFEQRHPGPRPGPEGHPAP